MTRGLFDFNAALRTRGSPDFQLTDVRTHAYNSAHSTPGSGYGLRDRADGLVAGAAPTCSNQQPRDQHRPGRRRGGHLHLHEHEARHDHRREADEPRQRAPGASPSPVRPPAPSPTTARSSSRTSCLAPTPRRGLTRDRSSTRSSATTAQCHPQLGRHVDRRATFKLDPGETVTCTITNLFAKLAVVKSASPAFYSKAGDVITYTVTTTNVGAATLTNVGVSDPLIPQPRAGPAPSTVRLSPSRWPAWRPASPSSARRSHHHPGRRGQRQQVHPQHGLRHKCADF